MKFLVLTLIIAFVSLASSRGGGGRGSSSGRSSSSSRGSSGFGSRSSGGGVTHFSSSSTTVHRTGGGSTTVVHAPAAFSTSVYSSGGLHHVTTTNTYIITNPSSSISYGGHYYYFGTTHYYASHPSHETVCVFDVGNKTTDQFGNIKYKNGTSLKEIVYGCGSGYYCCDFDCCRSGWSIFWTVCVILFFILIFICICCSIRNSTDIPADNDVTVITTTTTTIYPENPHQMNMQQSNYENAAYVPPSPNPSQKSYQPPPVYPGPPAGNTISSYGLGAGYQPATTNPYPKN